MTTSSQVRDKAIAYAVSRQPVALHHVGPLGRRGVRTGRITSVTDDHVYVVGMYSRDERPVPIGAVSSIEVLGAEPPLPPPSRAAAPTTSSTAEEEESA